MTKEEIRKVLELALEYYKLEIYGTGKESEPPTEARINWIYERMKPSLPSDLDEAAEESMPEAEGFLEVDIYGGSEAVYSREQMLAMYKAGAEWMAGQGYTKEETVYFERLCDENRIMVDLGWGEPERGGFNPGDKVIVQIRKKQ